MAAKLTEKDLAEARERFKRCAEAEKTRREAILAAKNFRAGNQWPDEIKEQRQGAPAIQGMAAQPPRPCLTIDRISQPTRQVSNSIRRANFAINVQPNGYGSDQDTADIQKGLLRWIQNRARAEAPVDWAADQAAEGGIGWFRLMTEYCADRDGISEGPELWDQDLVMARIPNNLSVYCDPAAMKPTRSDARFMFVVEDVPKDEFIRQWGEEKWTTLSEFSSVGDTNTWITQDTARVAEYWRVEFEDVEIVELKDGQTVLKSQAGEDAEIVRSRKVYRPQVRMSKITAVDELESSEWQGRRIPLFPILGEELNVDGQCVLRGVIGPAMDAQRMVNYMYSAMVEIVALAPKSPIVAAAGQIDEYKAIWQNANRYNFSYLPYDPVNIAGTLVPPPFRSPADPNLAPTALMLEKSEEGIKATTGIFDPSLGNTNPKEKSGRAIMALQQQSEFGQSNYADNVVTTLTECGDEALYLLPKVYDRPGRVIQILGIDDAPTQVMIGQPYQETPQGPQPVPEELRQAQQGMVKFYDFAKGRYASTVAVGKPSTTKRDEAAQILGSLLEKNPQLLSVFGDLFFRDLDFSGSQEIAERLKKLLLPPLQEQKDGQPNPEQQLMQLKQALQQAQQQLQELAPERIKLTQEQMRQQGETEREAIRVKSDLEIERMKVVAQLMQAEAKVNAQRADQMITAATAQLDHRVAVAGLAHEASENEKDRQHERGMAVHQSAEAEKDRQAAAEKPVASNS